MAEREVRNPFRGGICGAPEIQATYRTRLFKQKSPMIASGDFLFKGA